MTGQEVGTLHATQDLTLDHRENLTKSSICPIIIVSVIIAGMFLLGLGVLRFYAFRLECQLAEINGKIHVLELEELSLNEKLASLRSPERIYTIAQNKLGMQGNSDILQITVASRPTPDNNSNIQLAVVPKDNLFSALLNLFAKKAIASD